MGAIQTVQNSLRPADGSRRFADLAQWLSDPNAAAAPPARTGLDTTSIPPAPAANRSTLGFGAAHLPLDLSASSLAVGLPISESGMRGFTAVLPG
jgi:hypothetical protein